MNIGSQQQRHQHHHPSNNTNTIIYGHVTFSSRTIVKASYPDDSHLSNLVTSKTITNLCTAALNVTLANRLPKGLDSVDFCAAISREFLTDNLDALHLKANRPINKR